MGNPEHRHSHHCKARSSGSIQILRRVQSNRRGNCTDPGSAADRCAIRSNTFRHCNLRKVYSSTRR
jgi:hypothetical protein